MFWRLLIGFTLIVVVAIGVLYEVANHQKTASTGVNTSKAKTLDHVVIILEENEGAAHIIGNPQAPYINSLVSVSALATNYSAITHPSLPNYLALTSGTTGGITTDCHPPGPPSCQVTSKNIADEIEASGRSWKEYAESIPAACTPDNSGNYAVKHNPFMYYPDITSKADRCAKHVVPFNSFANDLKSTDSLPNYSFITPDICNDMHDCSIQTGDDWLKSEVPKILSSPAFTEQRSLLIITWDEAENTSPGNKVVTIFAGSAAKKGYKSNKAYSHYSLLHTIESQWKLAPLTDNDRSAPLMTEMLN